MTDTPNDWTDNDLEQLSRIAPNAGAPSERAVKVRNIIEQNISGVMFSSGQPKILVEAIGQLLDAECKAAAAAALEQAAEHIPEQSHEATGYLIRCACGWKSLAYKVDWRIEDGSSRGFSEWQQHIRALSPDPDYIALREADARIDEYRANEAAYSASLYVHGPGDVRTNFEKWRMWKEQHVAALTETRDRIAKETK